MNLNAMRRWIVFFAALMIGMVLGQVTEAHGAAAPHCPFINTVSQ